MLQLLCINLAQVNAADLFLATQFAESVQPSQHNAVRDLVQMVMNNFSRKDELLSLFDEDSQWCDPYPLCYQGVANISQHLHSYPDDTESLLLADPMVINGAVAGFMSTLSFSFPGDDDSCLYNDDQHVSWRLREADDGQLKLDYLRWVYNATTLADALRGCGSSTPVRAAADTDGSVRAVHDYVLPLMYSPKTFPLICDIIAPDGRYCDPYPETCVVGPDACRTIFTEGSGQSRPASIRPLMKSGPLTGAFFVHFSMASREGSTVHGTKHELHQTFALWSVANSSEAATGSAPAPLLSSWEWFYH